MRYLFLSSILLFGLVSHALADDFAADLPRGVSAAWDLAKAEREITPTRDRVCLNGLWRWQPAEGTNLPSGAWGYFKVPGAWPGITDYMQKDCQTVFAHSSWAKTRLGAVSAAWYQRQFGVPESWQGRRIVLSARYLNSFATVYVDGRTAGELRFPAGELDITHLCSPGRVHTLSVLVAAMPLNAVLLSYTDSASAREVKGSVPRRGLCGDVFLEGIRETARIEEAQVRTSVRTSSFILRVALANLTQETSYRIRTAVMTQGESVTNFLSTPFTVRDLREGFLALTNHWKPGKIWDVHTPENQFDATVSLLEAGGSEIDRSWPARFGFRELWIEGRDFYLNGTRIFLSAVPLDNAEVGAAWATYGAARESLERLKSFGINFVYTHNYGCEPGSHLSFDEVLRAADDAGMLVALSQPHFSHYNWKTSDADRANGYAAHARFYAEVAGSHPSVVFYAMSHNATGYSEDMNPDLIGQEAPRDSWSANNAKLALRAEAIVSRLDPSRIVYHHASGNLGSMHPMNFYPNFVPVQELSDWFGQWSTNGTKPAFMCEYGAPFTWDWTMYRGWYKGEREFGSARVPWELCVAEWNAQFLGDTAYQLSEAQKTDLRWEAAQFRAGQLWHRWDYPYPVGSTAFDERYPVFARYVTDNWRAFRGWGVSGISPWEYEHFWKLKPEVHRRREELPVNWQSLQRPGYSADYLDQRYERMDMAYGRDDWMPTEAAKALFRNNAPLLAFIGGEAKAFTDKAHNYFPGETVDKQIIVLNNSRETVAVRIEWSLDLPQAIRGYEERSVETGQQLSLPLRLKLSSDAKPGRYELHARVRFANREVQEDKFSIDVLPRLTSAHVRVALFDPRGETAKLLESAGVEVRRVGVDAELSTNDVLVVGAGALTLYGEAPDILRVRDGLKVVVFEQSAEVLEKRFGFRVAEYGLRDIFPRIPDHPLLSGIEPEHLHNWRGEATLLPPRRQYEMRPRYGPTVQWCDIPVTRLWRCGNRGNVASVSVEKPPCGDFLPILEGGFALQYSPLFEYREGQGLVLFSQLDLTGRTENDPAAETILRNLLRYVAQWRPGPKHHIRFSGSSAGQRFLESLGAQMNPESQASRGDLWLVDVEGAKQAPQLLPWLSAGGKLVAVGLDQGQAHSLLGPGLRTEPCEYINSYFLPSSLGSLGCGISPADLQNRDPRVLPLISSGANRLGNGVIAFSENPNVAYLQLCPWHFDTKTPNTKKTFRRAAFALSRLVSNLGGAITAPVLPRFHTPPGPREKRWLNGLYLDTPEEWDDPYRFFRW